MEFTGHVTLVTNSVIEIYSRETACNVAIVLHIMSSLRIYTSYLDFHIKTDRDDQLCCMSFFDLQILITPHVYLQTCSEMVSSSCSTHGIYRSCYSCYKFGDKSWMKKTPAYKYYKRNIYPWSLVRETFRNHKLCKYRINWEIYTSYASIFPIVNFPFICSDGPVILAYEVYISQLIRYLQSLWFRKVSLTNDHGYIRSIYA
jgi:hypothetical protein